jgi:hypothetical protein
LQSRGDKLVGVTTYCDYPLEAREIISRHENPNIENIIALRRSCSRFDRSQIEYFYKQLERQNIAFSLPIRMV